MKKMQVIGMFIILLAIGQRGNTQTTYTFTGTGNWTNAALWTPGLPPNNLPSGDTIVIAGDCNMNIGRNTGSGSVVIIQPGGILTLSTGNFVMGGLLFNFGNVVNNNNFFSEGTIFNEGRILSSSDFRIRAAGDSLVNNGKITISDGNFLVRRTFNNHDSLIIESLGAMNHASNGVVVNNYGVFHVYGFVENQRPFINHPSGDLTVFGGSIFELRNNHDVFNYASFVNHGVIDIHSGTLFNESEMLNTGALSVIGNDQDLVNNGVLVNQGIITNEGSFTNNGDLTNAPGGSITTGDSNNDVFDHYGLLVNNGIFNWNRGGCNLFPASTLMGIGNVNIGSQAGPVLIANGAIAPGNSIGTLTVTGDIAFSSTSTLQVEINGASGVNDVLAVSGAVTFDGTLNVSINGGTIDAGDSYNVVTYGSRTGTFTTVNLPGNAADWLPTPTYGAAALNLTYLGGSALPVTWLSFRAALEGDDVQLSWSTASESNNEGFDVQRSENGRDWQTIGFVPGAGTTSEVTNYSYTDPTPSTLNAQLIYYRLQQRDYDGTTDYSPIRVIQLGTQSGIRVFPNPADEAVTVAFAEPLEKRGTLQLFNQNGRLVAEEVLAPGTSEHTIRVAYLPAGTYVMRVVAGAQVWMQRVVVE
jgi:hypothetical protein